MERTKKRDMGIFKSVLIAYMILMMHVLVVASLGCLVIFFQGLVSYMFWIFLGGTMATLLSGYRFYRKMKKEGRTLKEAMGAKMFEGRSVEISFLGGFAAMKLGGPENSRRPVPQSGLRQLNSPPSPYLSELSELVQLLQDGLITTEEYNKAKKQLFDG